MLYALYQALLVLFEEGIERVFERHIKEHRRLVAGLDSMGMEMLVSSEYRLPMLNSVKVPKDVDEAAVRSALRKDHLIEIGAGRGARARHFAASRPCQGSGTSGARQRSEPTGGFAKGMPRQTGAPSSETKPWARRRACSAMR